MRPARFDRFGVFGTTIVIENQRTSGEIIAVARHRVGEIGHAGSLRCHITTATHQVVTLARGAIPSIQAGKRTHRPLIAILLSEHVGAHEAGWGLVAEAVRRQRERWSGVEAVSGVEKPFAAGRITTHHAQFVPPSVGHVLSRVRHRTMCASGHQNEQRRAEKHARKREHEYKYQRADANAIVPTQRKERETIGRAPTLDLPAPNQSRHEGENQPRDAECQQAERQGIDSKTADFTEELATVQTPYCAEGEAPGSTFGRRGKFAAREAGVFHHLITLPTYHTAALSTHELAKGYFGEEGMLAYVAGVQRKEIRGGIACVKHQAMAGSDIGDDHKEIFSGENALKAGDASKNTMNQFGN